MLSSLSIENYAIIDKLNIPFDAGFSVITGETGAGKSIIIGALGLVLGQRADTKTIKEGANKCVIEANFEIAEYHLEAFFKANELDYEKNCIIRREILPNGKTRSFINDTPVNLNTLKDLSIQLIDIHSQHENLLLNDKLFQLKVVDTIAKNDEELAQYQRLFSQYKTLKNELGTLIELAEKSQADKAYWQFQFDQLLTANIHPDEKNSLEDELQKISHTEEIKTDLLRLEQLLSNESGGIVISLKESVDTIRRLTNYLPETEEFEARINSAYIDLKDLAREINQKQSEVSFEPERLAYINERLDTIYSLEQKHRVNGTEALCNLQKELEDKLIQIDSFDDQINDLKKSIQLLSDKLEKAATQISIKRKAASSKIASHLIQQLASLGMKQLRFEVALSTIKEFSSTGKDQVDFLFSANDKSSLQTISQTASGGEISRVMLGLKSLIANTKALPTILFDEIDAGISGEIADKTASIMAEMSQAMQVICITHLPQIAAKGKQHYKVFKSNSTTKICQLSTNERITEIAQMLSGSSLSDAAIENAKILLGTT